MTTDVTKGGFDLWFTSSSGIVDGCSINIGTNINITSGSEVQNMNLVIERDGSNYYFSITNDSSVLYDSFISQLSYPKDFRICMHNQFISIYVNENWIHTFYFQNIEYPDFDDFSLSLESSGSALSLTNVKVVDLYDWREAVYIDFDTVAANAISSVIQQRPVEMFTNYLGEMKFQYSADDKRDVVNLFQKLITKHTRKNTQDGVISDAIVYGPYVEILTSESSASKHGFITKIIRIPELDTGARRAAKEYIKQGEQKSIQHTLVLRSDLRIEEGDILTCTYILSGTGRSENISFIVESIQIRLLNATFQMTITGRDYEE